MRPVGVVASHVSRFRFSGAVGNRYWFGFSRGMLEIGTKDGVEAPMKIVVSVAGMLRVVVACFVLGIVLGVYFGVAGSPSSSPAPPPADVGVPVNATAP